MENARNKESGNRNDGNTATATDTSGNAIADGNNLRSNGGNESPIDNRSTSGEIGALKSSGDDVRSASGNQEFAITDGHYFTPRGTIERIPNGHYIGSDGRLRKRRKPKQSDGSNTDGNAYRDRSKASEENEWNLGDAFPIDKPLNIRGGKRTRKKTIKEETSKLTMVTMLASGAAAIFTSVAMLTKHDHWKLHPDEAGTLAEALNDAISTLPEKYYAQIVAIIERWIPWINLTFVVSAIVIPRIEASAKRIEKSYSPVNNADDKRDAGTTDNPFSNYTSLGFNQ